MSSDYAWLDSSSDIMDALDAAESRAYAAEAALEGATGGEMSTGALGHCVGAPPTMQGAISTFFRKALSMATAGGWAYAAYTVFDQKDPVNPAKSVPHMPEVFGFGADVVTGVLASIAAFWQPKFIPRAALSYLDSIGTGSLDHWAVVTMQRAGAASAGIDVTGKVGGEGAQVGAANRNELSANQAGTAGAMVDRTDPKAYMTPAQAHQWEKYRVKRAA